MNRFVANMGFKFFLFNMTNGNMQLVYNTLLNYYYL